MQFETDEGKLLFATNLLALTKLELPLRMIKPTSAGELRDFLGGLAEDLFTRMHPR